jgi:hypothetical protein
MLRIRRKELERYKAHVREIEADLASLGEPPPDRFELDAAGELVRIELSPKVRTDAVVRGEAANVLERAAAELRAEGRRVVAEDAAE